ncbi:MAG: TonB-dependent receptor [Verrucomicrobia bacterium]|nr:TonB-dependent receptor [Verrucomicrobiota bacterium]
MTKLHSVFLRPSLLLAAALLACVFDVRAQNSGTGAVSGRVVNAATGAYLEGAEVSAGTGARVLTDRNGNFTLDRVPSGTQRLRVYYTGLDVATPTVDVRPGQTADVTVAVESKVLQLDAFTVSADREGEAASITRQRTAANVMNVVSTDAFGSVADGNIGNMMVRLPGVSGEWENGEVTGIKIRGTPPEFSAMNLDGVRASGAHSGFNTQGDRGAQSDQIPAEFIKEVQVTKAPTPDMPADSIGGSTNLVTKSALDFKENVLTYRVGANYNAHRDDLQNFTPNAAMTWLTRIGRGRDIGLALSLTYSDTEAPRDRVQTQRSEADGRATQARTLTNINQRIRGGAGLKFDYRLSERTSLALKFQHNYYFFDSNRLVYAASDSATRRVADYNVVSRAQIVAGTVPRTTANLTASVAPGYTDSFTEMLNAAWSFDGDNNERTGRQYYFDARGVTKLGGDQELRYQASFAPSTYKSNLRTFLMTLPVPNGIGMSVDTRGSRSRPLFRQTYGPSILFGEANFRLYRGQMQGQPETGEEEVTNAKVDYLKKFKSGEHPIEFKSGMVWRQQYRNLVVGRPNWNYTGADGIAGNADDDLASLMLPRPAYTVFNSGGAWQQLPGVDFPKAWNLFNTRPELFRPVGTSNTDAPNTSEITEDVYAAYVQGHVQFHQLSVLGGVRFERTEVDAVGRNTDPRRPTVARTTRTGGYDAYFPSLHLRYDLSRQLLARASYSTGAARPNMTDLYPTTTVSYSTTTGLGTVTQANSALKPQESENYDLSLEYYFEPAGVLSVGFFRKDITDFFSRTSDEIDAGTNNGFGGDFAGFTLNTTTNQGTARIDGFEINYTQRLTMLPKPFSGLGLFANYTRLKTSGQYREGATELAGFVPKAGNAGASFRWRKLEARVAWRYTGANLRSYNALVHLQNRFRPVESIDINLKYDFRPRLSVYFDIVNLKSKWPENYTGVDQGRITFSDEYGTRYNMGFSGRF